MAEATEGTMNLNLLKKCAVWGLAFCAVAISPVILIYGVLFGIGIVSDLVRSSDGDILALPFIAGWVWHTFRGQPA
jgi:hypothetical protein